jgi:tRNA dimethylallyltransferase
MQKVIAVVGPTASGKTGVAIEIAKKFDGEVISADSRQVYTGMDIGTGKVTKEEADGIPHHLIDIADPKEQYTVAHFVADGLRAIEDISSRGKLPIIAGGTGQYLDSLLYKKTIPEVPPNEKLREKLEKKTPEELLEILKDKDPERAETIEQKNKRRLIRALEIVEALVSVPKESTPAPRFDHLIIGLDVKKEMLDEKIHRRLIERIDEGMIEEAERLHKEGVSWERMEDFGLEYRYQKRYLCGELSKEEMLKQLETSIKQYAKRQRTWWRNRDDVEWFSPKNIEDIQNRVEQFLS